VEAAWRDATRGAKAAITLSAGVSLFVPQKNRLVGHLGRCQQKWRSAADDRPDSAAAGGTDRSGGGEKMIKRHYSVLR